MRRLTAIGYANLMLTVIAVALIAVALVLLFGQGEDDGESTYVQPTEWREPAWLPPEPAKDCGSGVYGGMCRIGKVPPLDPVE